ncbi:hypothetical protein ACA910_014527 [Epithemia clementina (nom. ined.)]
METMESDGGNAPSERRENGACLNAGHQLRDTKCEGRLMKPNDETTSAQLEQQSDDNHGKPEGNKLPGFLDDETLRLVEEYLREAYCGQTTRQDCPTAHSRNRDVCDEDKLVTFMDRIQRQAQLQTEFLVQTNFLLHDQIAELEFPSQRNRSSDACLNENGSSSDRILADFVKLEEEQALTRDIFQHMVLFIEKKVQTQSPEEKAVDHGQSSRNGVLDKRTLAWLRKLSGVNSGTGVSSANCHHPAIKSIVEDGGRRRLTRGMIARQQQDKEKQVIKRDQQDGSLPKKERTGTEGLNALACAIDDMEKGGNAVDRRSRKISTASKRKKAVTSTARVVRRKVTSAAVHASNQAQEESLRGLSFVTMYNTRLSSRQSSLERAVTPSNQRSKNKPPPRLSSSTKSASTYARLSHGQSSLETSTTVPTTASSRGRSKNKAQHNFSATSTVLRRTYAPLSRERSSQEPVRIT